MFGISGPANPYKEDMYKGRLEAFSDGVMAIIMTVMVLELKDPLQPSWEALQACAPVLSSYVLSFVYIGIYWSNHHHMLQSVKHVNGTVLWANHHLLFWLSLIPCTTSWMGSTHFSRVPVACYGIVLLANSVAYFILTRALIGANGRDSALAQAIGRDRKGYASSGLYFLAVLIAYWLPFASCAIYVLVALIWLAPDKRIERWLLNESES